MADRPTAGPATITVLDPYDEAIFSPAWDMPAKFLLFSTLAWLDERGDIEPRLARGWDASPDGRTWTFHLRNDVVWHDGMPFTARDVAFTVELLSRPEIGHFAMIETLEVRDDSTITIRFVHARVEPDSYIVIYPAHLLEKLDPEQFFEWRFWTQPVGTGPFRWARHVPGTAVELEANPDYFRGRPRVDRLAIKFGAATPLPELLSGRVDGATFVSRWDMIKLRDDGRFRVYHSIWPVWLEAIYWNQRNPLFADARVRRALTMAIDRQELGRLQHLPDGLPIFDVLFTYGQFRAGELPAPLPHDREGAVRLLEEAGWQDIGRDGVRQKDGRPFRFTAMVRSGGGAGFEQAAVYVQDALRRVGVRMDIQSLEHLHLMARLGSGDFEAAFGRFFQPHAAQYLGAETPLGYDSPRVREILEALRAPSSIEARDSLHRELWPVLATDVPLTFLAPQVLYYVAHRRLRGFSSPFRADILMHLEDAWVEEGT